MEITYDEPGPDEPKRPFPLYSVEYENDQKATFSIESAREGIGDRNIMEEENTEETEIQTPLGPMYLIYRPKGKNSRKDEIKANWVSDANMNVETSKNAEHQYSADITDFSRPVLRSRSSQRLFNHFIQSEMRRPPRPRQHKLLRLRFTRKFST